MCRTHSEVGLCPWRAAARMWLPCHYMSARFLKRECECVIHLSIWDTNIVSSYASLSLLEHSIAQWTLDVRECWCLWRWSRHITYSKGNAILPSDTLSRNNVQLPLDHAVDAKSSICCLGKFLVSLAGTLARNDWCRSCTTLHQLPNLLYGACTRGALIWLGFAQSNQKFETHGYIARCIHRKKHNGQSLV